jgi:hypothetical protein
MKDEKTKEARTRNSKEGELELRKTVNEEEDHGDELRKTGS